MAKRKIIEIDRDLCNGCGFCTTACAEGALRLDKEGKAVLVRELYCDGMGACLDVCPTNALKIVERDGDAYDPKAAYKHVLKARGMDAAKNVHGLEDGDSGHGSGSHKAKAERPAAPLACGCPGSMAREIKRDEIASEKTVSGRSELTQWPIQLHLVSPLAPYLQGADLLVAADCTAFSLGSFHQDLLKSKKLVIACPKLDETEGYVEKLAEIIRTNNIRSLTVAVMTVPCCAGLVRMVEDAVMLAGADLRPRRTVIGIDGRIADG
ncbi:MAG: 4Fe-4S dicluster domain-containing protein [Acidobacteriota bacterium]|nr:4Fe-4S dicluster domain-containing protein [Acidobacteriota bacterium]